MNFVHTFIIYLTLFRLSIITAGVVSIVLGYRLFCKGIWPEKDSGKETSVAASVAGTQITLKNAAPGTCFALFGVVIISVMFASSSPEMTLSLVNKAAQTGQNIADKARDSELSVKLKGDEKEGLLAAIARGISYEKEQEPEKAITAYKEAISMISTPMNNLAWLYLSRGEIDKALPLSRQAVQLLPENADFLDTLAEIHYKKEEYSEALNLMEKAVRIDPVYKEKLPRFREAVKR